MTPKEMFIVQKCWFDGPNVQPPQDYLALFSDRAQAENVSSQSAYIHAAHHQAVVRTILLPSGYAFSAAGDLFWIRSVHVNDIDVGDSCNWNGILHKGAHVISNRGVIGGTGNVNSRRGSETKENVVFVGANSHARALEVLMRGGSPANSHINHVSLAPLPNLLDGWSDTGTGSMIKEHPKTQLHESLKRSVMQAANIVLHNEALADSSDYRPLKRHCFRTESHQNFSHQTAEQVDAVMHSP